MSEDLKLTLDRDRGGSRGPGGPVIALLSVIVLLTAATLVLTVGKWRIPGAGGGSLPAQKLEKLALRLEEQSLSTAAALAWKDYLAEASPGNDESAGVWYRIGKLYQDGGEYEMALDAYYRSESIARLESIESDISLRVSECLERLGRFAALRSELEARTAFDPGVETPGAEVLAEIGNRKITRSDLEAMIERQVDAQLSQLAGSLPPDQLKAQKEKLLDEVLKEGEQLKWLESLVAQELLYRRAMEDRIYDTESYRSLAREMERQLLIQKLLEKEYADKVSVTEDEVRAYYEANREKFGIEGETLPFDQAARQAYAAVRAQKEGQIQAGMIDFLMDRYDVVIHRSKFRAGEKEEGK